MTWAVRVTKKGARWWLLRLRRSVSPCPPPSLCETSGPRFEMSLSSLLPHVEIRFRSKAAKSDHVNHEFRSRKYELISVNSPFCARQSRANLKSDAAPRRVGRINGEIGIEREHINRRGLRRSIGLPTQAAGPRRPVLAISIAQNAGDVGDGRGSCAPSRVAQLRQKTIPFRQRPAWPV